MWDWVPPGVAAFIVLCLLLYGVAMLILWSGFFGPVIFSTHYCACENCPKVIKPGMRVRDHPDGLVHLWCP